MTDGPYDRKVQLTGGTTYTVSLPKDWATEQSVDIGDRVRLYDRGDRLLVTQPDADADRRTVSIPAASRSPEAVARTLTAAYLTGAERVRVEGAPDRDTRAAVEAAVGGLVGIEIAEESEATIVARSMLDVGDLSPKQTVTQMVNMALRMHEDALTAALDGDGDAGDRVRDRDDTVDRLFGLIAREFQRSLVDARVDGAAGELTTFDYYTTARQVERVADHAVRMGEAAEPIESPPPELAAELRRVGADARRVVDRAVSETLNGGGPDVLGDVLIEGSDVVAETDRLDRSLHDRTLDDGYALATVLDAITRTAEYGINVAEAGLQAAIRDSRTEAVSEANGTTP